MSAKVHVFTPRLIKTPREFRASVRKKKPTRGLKAAVRQIKQLEELIGTLWNVAALQSSKSMILLGRTSHLDITPGTELQAFKKTSSPTVVYIRASTGEGGDTAFLYLAREKGFATNDNAEITEFGENPETAVVVPPGVDLWANMTDPSGGAGTARKLTVTVLPLAGRPKGFGG